jgi:HTH-type transcriptional regulator, global nitrogen regulator NrpRI
MKRLLETKELEILDVLREAGRPLGARLLSQKLAGRGIELNERTVGYHLLLMDERGLTRMEGERGRVPTERGLKELERSRASDRIGFVSSRIDSLAFKTTFDLEKGSGELVVNFSLIPRADLAEALAIMCKVVDAGFCLSGLAILKDGGERMGDVTVPEGQAGIGTVCSVSLNAILLKRSIPVVSRFGGLLEVAGGKPSRFLEIISYEGSTLDPIEIFIKGGMTSVGEAAADGDGIVCASFREVPSDADTLVAETFEAMREYRLGGFIHWGKPSQAFLQVPVGRGRLGLVVAGGLNPIAAVEEAGIATESKAMVSLVDYRELVPLAKLKA